MPQIAGALPMISKIMPAVTGGMGMISNIMRGNRVNEAQTAALKRQKELDALIKNPALLAQKVQAMTQPLNAGLVQGVENQAQAGLAERGLGTSPQIANEVFGQALGPYQHQNQMEALRSVLQMYGMDESMLNSIVGMEGQPTDTSGLWGSMQKPPGEVVPFSAPGGSVIPKPPGDMAPPGDIGQGSMPDIGSWFPPETPGATNDVPFPGAEGLF